MDRSPHPRPQEAALDDRLISCLWWLVFLGGVASGTVAGVVLALRLVLPSLGGLLLIGACWLVGNAIGWRLAARLDMSVARKESNGDRRRHSGIRGVAAGWNPGQAGDARARVTLPGAHAASGTPVQPRVLACP